MTDLRDLVLDLYLNFNINATFAEVLVTLTFVVLWLIIGITASRFTKMIIFKLLRVNEENQRTLTVANLIASIAKYIVWFIIVIVLMAELKISITPFLASAGILGIVIGLGSQAVIMDFLNGFFIITEHIFDIGDIIEVNGYKGRVVDISLRTTRILNYKGDTKTVNNGDVKNVINFSKDYSLAIVEFGVSYKTDLKQFKDHMPEFVSSLKPKYPVIMTDAEYLGVTELADSYIGMRIVAKTEASKHFQVERDIREDLVVFLKSKNVEIPFPQIVIHNE